MFIAGLVYGINVRIAVAINDFPALRREIGLIFKAFGQILSKQIEVELRNKQHCQKSNYFSHNVVF